MDIHEFSNEPAEVAKNMSEEECATTQVDEDGVPVGPTERLVKLKENFLKQTPSITTYRARAVTKITKENPGMPKILLRAKVSVIAVKQRLLLSRTTN